jgi:hypothetical protein
LNKRAKIDQAAETFCVILFSNLLWVSLFPTLSTSNLRTNKTYTTRGFVAKDLTKQKNKNIIKIICRSVIFFLLKFGQTILQKKKLKFL